MYRTAGLRLRSLKMLMGGGGSFSAGGSGKGMHSRLYLRVLNQYQEIQSFSAFNSISNHTGLFGIYGSTGSDFVATAVDLAGKELIEIATPGRVSQLQLNRAKEATISAVLMNLESGMIVAEGIGRQILTYGEREPVERFLKTVDEITLEDITSIGQKILSSPLTMDITSIGYEPSQSLVRFVSTKQQKKPARAPTDSETTTEMATKSLPRTGTSVIGRLVSTRVPFQPPTLTHRRIVSNGEGFNICPQLFPSLSKFQIPPEDDVSVPSTPSSWFLYPSGLPSLRFFLPDGDSSNEPLICFPKRTFQPSTIKRKRTHGYFARKATKGGRKVIARRIAKGRSRITA